MTSHGGAMSLTEGDLERIGERIAIALNEALSPIEKRLAAGDAKFATLKDAVDAHDHALDGNGRPGVVETVRDHEKSFRFWRRMGWLFLGAMSLPLVGGLVAAAVFLIKAIP